MARDKMTALDENILRWFNQLYCTYSEMSADADKGNNFRR